MYRNDHDVDVDVDVVDDVADDDDEEEYKKYIQDTSMYKYIQVYYMNR